MSSDVWARDVARSGPSPSRHVRRQERFSRLQQAVDRLKPDHRTVILLARIERLRIKEIAERIPDIIQDIMAK